MLSKAGGRALGAIIAKYKAQVFMSYSTYTKLFDSSVTPVLDYFSSVWGFSKYNCLEAIQNRAIRIYLGVHKFAPILALQLDIGRVSTENRQCLSVLRFLNRLLKLPDNRLTKRIFIDDFYLAQSGHENWCSNVFKVLEKLNLKHLFYERKMVDIKEIKDQNDMWKKAVPKKPKLRTYYLFKETMDIENYIKYNLSSSERSAMAQFRFGILQLNIETGRFRNQALGERLCTLCEFNEIEDESHFLFQCRLYDELRSEWVSNFVNKTANFLELDKLDKFKVIFDNIIHHRITANFILRCCELRKESLYRI